MLNIIIISVFISIQANKILCCEPCGNKYITQGGPPERTPYCLACGHTLCSHCFDTQKRVCRKELKITCPTCYAGFTYSDVRKVPINRKLQKIIKDFEAIIESKSWDEMTVIC